MKEVEASTSLHQELKLYTKDIHEELHVNPSMLPLVSPHCSFTEYKSVIASFHAFYSWAESKPRQFHQPRFIGEANVSDWLNKDIGVIGLNRQSLQHFSSNVTTQLNVGCQFIPPFEQYLGFLYVKQGSTLGGQVIASFLNKSLQLIPGKTLFLFSGYQRESKSMWQSFLQYLSLYSESVDRQAVMESAAQHFLALKQILDTAYEKRNEYVF